MSCGNLLLYYLMSARRQIIIKWLDRNRTTTQSCEAWTLHCTIIIKMIAALQSTGPHFHFHQDVLVHKPKPGCAIHGIEFHVNQYYQCFLTMRNGIASAPNFLYCSNAVIHPFFLVLCGPSCRLYSTQCNQRKGLLCEGWPALRPSVAVLLVCLISAQSFTGHDLRCVKI